MPVEVLSGVFDQHSSALSGFLTDCLSAVPLLYQAILPPPPPLEADLPACGLIRDRQELQWLSL
jgi:hypothetical protein